MTPGVWRLLDEQPFIRYDAAAGVYRLHAMLRELLLWQLELADGRIRRACYARAGDWFARSGDALRALACFWKVREYEAILSLPLTHLTLARVGEKPVAEIALALAKACPEKIGARHPIALLRLAYALLGAGERAAADALLERVRRVAEAAPNARERRALLGEWMLIGAYREFPDVVEMEPLVRAAAELLDGRCRVLAPEEPFGFGCIGLLTFFCRRSGALAEECAAFRALLGHLERLTGRRSAAGTLLRAETLLYRGALEEAEVVCRQASYAAEEARQPYLQLGSALMLVRMAAMRGDAAEFGRGIEQVEAVRDERNPFLVAVVKELVRSDLYLSLGRTDRLPEWLRKGESALESGAPAWLRAYARSLQLRFLCRGRDCARALGAAAFAAEETDALLVGCYNRIATAGMCLREQRRDPAFALVRECVALLSPDALYLPLLEAKKYLAFLVEEAFAALEIAMPQQIAAEGKRIGENWQRVVRFFSGDGALPYGMTQREMEVAALAARGCSNREIARALRISERTVKFHLSAVYGKMGIDRRTKLVGRLRQ